MKKERFILTITLSLVQGCNGFDSTSAVDPGSSPVVHDIHIFTPSVVISGKETKIVIGGRRLRIT